MTTRLSTLVLRCADIDRTQVFYSALGLTFTFEQHGNSPGHYSSAVGGSDTPGALVLELYPMDATRIVSGPGLLEFEGEMYETLERGPLPKGLGRPRHTKDGLRFVDPDGRIVWMKRERT